MGLLDEIAAQRMNNNRLRCGISSVLEALNADDRADLEAAFGDSATQHVMIVAALRARGFAITEKTVAAHRNGKCSCVRSR